MLNGDLSRSDDDARQASSTLGAALEAIGDRFTVVGDAAAHEARRFVDVRFHDDAEDPESYRGCVVLCPGIGGEAVGRLRRRLDGCGATAMIVPGSVADDFTPSAASAVDIVTLALGAGDWADLAHVLRSLLVPAADGPAGGVRPGDLFGLANALASLAGAAVSLVDATGQVVGYSTHSDQPIDEMRRRSTLLLREEVPLSLDPEYRAVLAARGPRYFPPASTPSVDDFGRVAIAVRAAGEFLGSVWVVQVDDASVPGTERLLTEVEPLIAEHMLQARERADDDDRRDSALLRTLVEDPGQARIAVSQLMIRPGDGCCVVCFRLQAADDVAAARGLHRLLALVRSITSTSALLTRATIIGPQVVALVAGAAPDRVRAFSTAVTRVDAALVAGIGSEVRTAVEISRSYREALACAALLITGADPRSHTPRSAGPRVATFPDLRDRLAIQHLGDVIASSEQAAGDAAERLFAHDRANGGELAATILAYLDLHGSVRATADALHVHQNTVRYRLDVLRRDLDIDLTVPDTRLWLWLRLATALHDPA